jgi:amino-acid N-acetyltransferase
MFDRLAEEQEFDGTEAISPLLLGPTALPRKTREFMLIRPATLTDVPGILALVNEHVRRGDLLPRTAESIRSTLPDWLVGEMDSTIVACVSLLYYTPILAEVRSLAVSDEVKGQGWGRAIVTAIIAKAEREQVPTLFALTRAVHFFEKAGFSITEKDHFPEKVWRDCHVCPLLHHCDETAVILRLVQS